VQRALDVALKLYMKETKKTCKDVKGPPFEQWLATKGWPMKGVSTALRCAHELLTAHSPRLLRLTPWVMGALSVGVTTGLLAEVSAGVAGLLEAHERG
jgi:hypothetical protein